MVASSLDRRQIHQAIDQIRLQMGGSDFEVALQLASAIASRQPDTQVVILSDGRFSLPEQLIVKGNLRYSPIGIRGQNQAINLLTAEINPGGSAVTAFVQVINYSTTDVMRRLGIFADGQLFNVYDLSIPAGQSRPLLAEEIPATTQIVEARLMPGDGVADDLSLDDSALAVLRKSAPAQVNLVSQGNRFLETVLNLLPNIQVTRTNPDDQGNYPAADLTIFDNFIPITSTLPQGNLFFIAPPRSTEFFTITGSLKQPVPRAAGTEHPLLQHIQLDGVNILDSAQIALPGWAEPVIVTEIPGQEEKYPLLFGGEKDGRRIAVLAFDLRHSDLPLQIAFPLLLANLTQWLAPGISGEIPNQVTPGSVLTFSIPPIGSDGQEITSIDIVHPDGTATQMAFAGGQLVFADTGQLGLYEIKAGSNAIPFVVNLFLPQESDNNPADSLTIAGVPTGSQSASDQQARKEWWRPLAALALLLLTAEWLVYQRSALAFLANKIKPIP